MELALALTQTRIKKKHLASIGRHRPRAQGHEKFGRRVVGQPQPQRVFFITDEITGASGLDRAATQGGGASGEAGARLFLYSLVAAGRSVASIIATAGWPAGQVVGMRRNKTALISRSTRGVSKPRNSCNWRGVGSRRKLGRCAKRRQERCSGKSAQSRLVERAGVKSSSSNVRKSWAELQCARRPPLARGTSIWISRSGIKGETNSSKAEVPVVGIAMA